MAVYTHLSQQDIAQWLTRYDLGELTLALGIAEGVENTNYLIETLRGDTAEKYILTLFEKRTNAADIPFFMEVKQHLNKQGIACPHPIAACDGAIVGELAHRPAVVVSFLEGASQNNCLMQQCYQLGAYVARMHTAMDSFTATRPNDLSVSGWHALWQKLRGDEQALSRWSPEGEGDEWIVRIESLMQTLTECWPSDLPTGVIHADLFPDNVFFQHDHISGVIDFYFACTDFYAYDLAICMNAWCYDDAHRYDAAKGEALLEGYDSVRGLSDTEREAFPLLRQGAAMRFFLTRLHDWVYHPPEAMVTAKDPNEYWLKLGG